MNSWLALGKSPAPEVFKKAYSLLYKNISAENIRNLFCNRINGYIHGASAGETSLDAGESHFLEPVAVIQKSLSQMTLSQMF